MPGRPTGPAGAVPSCGPNGAVAYLAAERRCITTTTTAATTTTAVVGKRVPILAKLLTVDAGRLIALVLRVAFVSKLSFLSASNCFVLIFR